MSVLNVFKTSVDTINASSITSDMTIGANLNGGSLTLGGAGATTNINSNITNIAATGLSAGARVSIATGTNATNTEMTLGSKTLSYNNIRGNIIHIADTGLSATGKVHIASGVNGGNATGSEIKIGDWASSTTLKGITTVDGSTINTGTNIFCIKQNTGSIDNVTDGIRDPLTITSPSGSTTAFLSLGMGVDTTYNCGYINCAMVGQGRPLVLCPRLGNVFVGSLPTGFNANNNSYTNSYGNLIVSGNIYCGSPIIPKYSYPVGEGKIGEILEGTMAQGLISEGGIVSRIYVSSSGVWHFSWNIQFVLINATYIRPEFHIYGVTSFNIQVSSMIGQSSYYMMTGSYISKVDSGTNGHGTIYMNYAFSGWNPYDVYGNFRAVRIA